MLRKITLIILLYSPVHATVLTVPGMFTSIQSAIDAAVNGDTVEVSPGIYYENINFRGKGILVTSRYYLTGDTSLIYNTVINGSQPVHTDTASCVFIGSGEDSTSILDGFTLTKGYGTRLLDIHNGGIYREGGGILIEVSSPEIRNNLIIDNEAVLATSSLSAGGGGIRIGDGNPWIHNNVIVFNRGKYGAGIVLNYTGGVIENNVICYNTGGQDYGGGGIWCQEDLVGFNKRLVNNTIAYNYSYTVGGGLLVRSTNIETRNNIIWGNAALNPIYNQIRLQIGGTLTATYNDVEGGFAGNGNINALPMFTDSLTFNLQLNSPCVDTGDSSAIYNDLPDPLNPGFALAPSMGTIRNDMGANGGPQALWLPVPHQLIVSVQTLHDGHSSNYIYPQPATDHFYLKTEPQTGDRHAVIADISGKETLEVTIPAHHSLVKIDVQYLKAGIYFLLIEGSSGIRILIE